jgi:hypothetical protein
MHFSNMTNNYNVSFNLFIINILDINTYFKVFPIGYWVILSPFA